MSPSLWLCGSLSIFALMQIVPQVIFAIILGVGVYIFSKNVGTIRKNILSGRDEDRSDRKADRWKTMLRVAFGQSKMAVRPIPAMLHFIVYAGFILINIEVLEIIIDGLFGTHRVLDVLGPVYDAAIGFFEVLAVLVLISCVLFLTRRFIARISRFHAPEMKGWPTKDATNILVIEIVLMLALLVMNAADYALQQHGADHYTASGAFPVSSMLFPIFDGMADGTLMIIERTAWWFHIVGILAFLNYLPFSKHFHIILAFPNTYYSKLKPAGEIPNMESVTNEVKMMMGMPVEGAEDAPPPESFGAKDVNDLSWTNLMNAYSCTECGRCTSVCPANQTGKLLSPRKVMMDTRDRLEEFGKIRDGKLENDESKNVHSYISAEELWACTSCNACTDACPVNIDPLDIIMQMRQYLVMEQSNAPQELNMMFTNMENNGAPWQFPPSDRDQWKNDLTTNQA